MQNNDVKALHKQADDFLEQGNLQSALKNYYSILELNTHDNDALVMCGSILAETGNITSAIEYLNTAINYNSKNIDAYVILGHIKKATSNPKDALDYFLKAEEIEPSDFEVLCLLGEIYKELNDSNNAIIFFEKAVASKATDANIWAQLGYLQQNNNDLIGAEKSYLSALNINSVEPTASAGIITVLINQNKYTDVIKHIDILIQENPDNNQYKFFKSDTLEKQGDIEASFDIIQPFLESDDIYVDAVLILARYCKQLDLVDECIELLDSIISGQDISSGYVNKAISAKQNLTTS